MDRRNLIKSASLAVPGIALGAKHAAGKAQESSEPPIIVDGLGEIHPYYPMELIG